MLSKEENALLCEVQPGKPMHEAFKRYWLPCGLSSDVAEPDSDPTTSTFSFAPGRDAIDTTFVFVLLLIRHADDVGQLMLAEAEHHAAFTDARTDMAIDILGPFGHPRHLCLREVAARHRDDRVTIERDRGLKFIGSSDMISVENT